MTEGALAETEPQPVLTVSESDEEAVSPSEGTNDDNPGSAEDNEAIEQNVDKSKRPVPPIPPVAPPATNKNASVELSDVFVLGVICQRCDNFNHPNAPYYFVDGHRLVETRILQRAKRPTLGHLRLDHDGTHIQLLRTVVLGRAHDVSPLVENQNAGSIHLEDPSMNLSRSHAVVELRDWGVFLRNDGSQNGTWVVTPHGSRRRPVSG